MGNVAVLHSLAMKCNLGTGMLINCEISGNFILTVLWIIMIDIFGYIVYGSKSLRFGLLVKMFVIFLAMLLNRSYSGAIPI